MSTLTKNLNLIKPELGDVADITLTNPNWDEIDARLAILATSGYGEPMESIDAPNESYDEYCERIDAVLANMPNKTIKLVSVTPPYSEAPNFGACATILYKGNDAYASLMPIGHSNIYAYGWRMQKRAGDWQPFEWVNPPMEHNTLYRTTERYGGQPVYAMAVNVGTVNSTKTVDIPWFDPEEVVSITATAVIDGAFVDLGCIGAVSLFHDPNNGQESAIKVETGNKNATKVYVTVKYTMYD